MKKKERRSEIQKQRVERLNKMKKKEKDGREERN